MQRIGQDGWLRRLLRHGPGVALFAGAALAGGALGLVPPSVPWWLPGLLFVVVAAAVARTYELAWRPTTRDCHVRAGVHVVGLALVTHVAGWGALLVPMHLLPASDLQRTTGMAVGSIAVRWAAWATAAGQLLVWVGVVPTMVPREVGLGAALVQLLVVRAVVLRLERDETDLAAIAAQAQAQAARMRAVLAASRDAVVVARAGEVVLVSPRVLELLGLPDDDTIGALLGRVHPDDVTRLALVFAGPTARRDAEGSTRVRLRHADGAWRELDATWRDHVGADEVVVQLRDITEVDRLREELERAARVDVLTGLGNRRVLDARLPQLISLVDRGLTTAAVLLLDLDGFKAVNDVYGHLAGDDLLRVLSERMSRCVRGHDTVVRTGGDEFVVLLEGLDDPDAAHVVARRLLDGVAGDWPVDGGVVRIGISIGLRRIDAGVSVREHLADADRAMYHAKRAGGSRVVAHEETAQAPPTTPGPDAAPRAGAGGEEPTTRTLAPVRPPPTP